MDATLPDFSFGETVEFQAVEICLKGAPTGKFLIGETLRHLKTRELLFVRLRPDAVINGNRVEMIPPRMLQKTKTATG